MDLPSKLDNTESVTKFLRNKDTSVDEIYNFVIDILYNGNDQNCLPYKEKFILELLIDRISQSSKLTQKFKQSEKTWKLFNFIWNKCKADSRLISVRSKVLSRLKFGEVFTKIFAELSAAGLYKNTELVDELLKTVDSIINSTRIHLSDDQNLMIINHLLEFAVKEPQYTTETHQRLLSLVIVFFQQNNKGNLKYDNKHRAEFAKLCLPNLLMAMEKHATPKIKDSLSSIIVQLLFSETDPDNVVSLIGCFSKAENASSLGESEILDLLRLIIPKISIGKLEEVAQILVSAFPQYSAVLIKEIAEMNKSLSSTFLSNLVEEALGRKDGDSHKLIIYSIRRNADICLKYTDKICELCQENSEFSMPLLKELFDSYAKNRDLDLFVKIWSDLISKYPGSIFESDSFIDYVSLKYVTLSNTQLSALVETEVNEYIGSPNQNPIFLLSICKGLLKAVSGSIQNAVSKTLLHNLLHLKALLVSLVALKGQYCWKLRFYIFSLFDVEELADDAKYLVNQKHENDSYYFFTMLRIFEQNTDLANDKFTKNLDSFYRKKSDSRFKSVLFSRFFMILEELLEVNKIKKFVEVFLKESNQEVVRKVFSNPLIQTRPKIMSCLIEECIKHNKMTNYLQFISVYAFTKTQRQQVLDLMVERLDDHSSMLIIENILKMPTYKSKLETEFDSLLKLARKGCQFSSIIVKIMNIHLQQPTESAKYIHQFTNSIAEVINKISPRTLLDSTDYLELFLLFVKDCTFNDPKMNTLKEKLIETAVKEITHLLSDTDNLSAENIEWILTFLTEINFCSKVEVKIDSLKVIVSQLGEKYTCHREMKLTIFRYICSLDDIYKPSYVIALFLVLNTRELDDTIDLYLSKLASREEDFLETWINIHKSFEESNPEDIESYIRLFTLMIKNVQKPTVAEKVKTIHTVFVSSISQIYHEVLKNDYLTKDIVALLNCLKTTLSTKTWIFTQYATELNLAFISHISSMLLNREDEYLVKNCYVELCQVTSSVILYQRKRISNRHHMINSVLTSLLKTLLARAHYIRGEGSLAFERLVSNLCEPNANNLYVKQTDNSSKDIEINNALSQIKSAMRKFIPVVIFNYITFYLKYQVDPSIKHELENAIFMMIDLLTLNELNYINRSLDHQSRQVFRNIYEEYKKFYKWNENS